MFPINPKLSQRVVAGFLRPVLRLVVVAAPSAAGPPLYANIHFTSTHKLPLITSTVLPHPVKPAALIK